MAWLSAECVGIEYATPIELQTDSGSGLSSWFGFGAQPRQEIEHREEGLEPTEQQADDTASSALDVPLSGVRRDRTQFFRGSRRRGYPPTARQRQESEDGSVNLDELQLIHALASQAHTSIASKLAQHNGFLQIGLSMPERVMPVEMRLCATTVEVSIEAALADLDPLLVRLSRLEVEDPSKSPQDSSVRRALRQYIEAVVLSPMRATFEEQRGHLAELHAASPLTSPKMSFVLHERLAVACSPPSSPRLSSTRAPSSASSCSAPTPLASPLASPRPQAARGPALSGDWLKDSDSCSKNDSEHSCGVTAFGGLMGMRQSSFEIVEQVVSRVPT